MYFSKLKEKAQKAYRIKSYDEIFTNVLVSMFTYRGEKVPKEILTREQFVNLYSVIDGAAAIVKLTDPPASNPSYYDNKYIVGSVDFGGNPDPYGIGSKAIVSTDNGWVKEYDNWVENPDIAIFFNDDTFSPDMNIGRFADMAAELEVSIKLNLLFSRMYPIPLATDTKGKKSIEEAIKNMQDGKIATILDERKLREQIEGYKGIDTVNLTDVDKAQYIQYLAKFRDDLMRWFYSLYGMNSQGSSKLAQQTVDEVNQDNNSSMILPHSMFRARKAGCDMCNEKFGWDMEVSFSECWMSRLANMDDEFKTTDEELEDEAPEGKEEEKDEVKGVSDKTDSE